MQKLSIAAALNQFKIIKDRIEKAMDTQFVGVQQNDRVNGYNGRVPFQDQARAGYQSVLQLMANYTELKAKVIQSNATTNVTVAGVTMTVAQAIERKHSIATQQSLLARLVGQFTAASGIVARDYARVVADADGRAVDYFGGKVDKKASEFEEFVQGFITRNAPKLADPIGIETQIERHTRETQDFLAEVDLVLTSSNVVTIIEVSF